MFQHLGAMMQHSGGKSRHYHCKSTEYFNVIIKKWQLVIYLGYSDQFGHTEAPAVLSRPDKMSKYVKPFCCLTARNSCVCTCMRTCVHEVVSVINFLKCDHLTTRHTFAVFKCVYYLPPAKKQPVTYSTQFYWHTADRVSL